MRIDLDTLSMPTGFYVAAPNINANQDECDVNGDGFADMIFGSPYSTPYAGLVNQRVDAGIVYVIFGKSSGFANIAGLSSLTMPQGFQILGAHGCGLTDGSCTDTLGNTGDWTGSSVSCSDVNGDGKSDILIYSHFAGFVDSGGNYINGGMYVIFGKSSGFSDIDLLNLNIATGFRFLASIGINPRNGGDMNGDGYEDVIIGVPSYDSQGAGFTIILYGRSTWTGDIDWFTDTSYDLINGNYVDGHSGRSLSMLGNFNGDQYDDIIISNPLGSHTGGIGYIVFGNSSRFADNVYLDTLVSNHQAIEILGTSTTSVNLLNGIEDLNGDGLNDVVISGSQGIVIFGSNYSNSIDLSTFTTDSSGFLMTREYLSTTIGPGSWPVSGVGDFNGDGKADFLVGTGGSYGGPYFENNYLVLGHPNPFGSLDLNNHFNLPNYIRIDGTIPAAEFVNGGVVVTKTGDINGDGFADLCFSNPGSGKIYYIFGGSDLSAYDVPDPTASNSKPPEHNGGQHQGGGGTGSSNSDAGTVAGAVIGTLCAVGLIAGAAYFFKNKNAPAAAAAASTQLDQVKAFFVREDNENKKNNIYDEEDITELHNISTDFIAHDI